jgi:phospholipid transport system transporter-binding protein
VIAERLGKSDVAGGAVFRASEDGRRWLATGALTFANAGPALAVALALPLPSSGRVACEGITAVDSAAVALLLALKRHGAERGTPLVFDGVPPALATLAELYGVEDVLGA